MVHSNDTTNTVSAVEGRVTNIEQAADTTHRHVVVIDDILTRLDKKVEPLKHEMGIREGKDADFQKTQETLVTRVETTGKRLATFRKEQTAKEETDSKILTAFNKELSGEKEGTNKRLDTFYKELSIVKLNTAMYFNLRQRLMMLTHAPTMPPLKVSRITNRTDDLQVCQQDTASLWEVTNDLQAWRRKAEVELARLSKREVKWSIVNEEAKKYSKQK